MARNSVAFTSHFPAKSQPASHFSSAHNTGATHNQTRRFTFTYDDLYNCLYRHNEPQLIDIEAFKGQRKTNQTDGDRLKETTSDCAKHKASHSSRKLHVPGQNEPVKLSYAIASFPEEVQLCVSSIPGAGCGVCAKQHIPVGTWIGPYEGKLVKCDEIKPTTDTSYMWEIYQEGKLSHYLDASDENTSSWMRFIRCARYREEQNLFSFQYCGNIYYRAFREISVGAELLVWYDEKYPQDMGIPLEVQDMALVDPNGMSKR
ncbi:putative histone-lysine N-methyltransferase PRDM6 [Acropora cervicornis]|uniref:Histone-lysine N-methyltransferase PRDM6 n=1 Tax=Acropora cervicornis TaxID=6130 RepID=A0AAD9QKN2_ACRCE|nr:putative histone-lysine N-methyltransferase PRDM6 [Acropora cervicornis]